MITTALTYIQNSFQFRFVMWFILYQIKNDIYLILTMIWQFWTWLCLIFWHGLNHWLCELYNALKTVSERNTTNQQSSKIRIFVLKSYWQSHTQHSGRISTRNDKCTCWICFVVWFRRKKILQTMTSVWIRCNTFCSFLCMVHKRLKLKNVSTNISNGVKSLLESDLALV